MAQGGRGLTLEQPVPGKAQVGARRALGVDQAVLLDPFVVPRVLEQLTGGQRHCGREQPRALGPGRPLRAHQQVIELIEVHAHLCQ